MYPNSPTSPAATFSPAQDRTDSSWLALPGALLAVNRVIDDVRRGAMVGLQLSDTKSGLGVVALEAIDRQHFDDLKSAQGSTPQIVMTGRRAAVLGLWNAKGEEPPKVIIFTGEIDAIANLATHAVDPFCETDPLSADDYTITQAENNSYEAAAVHLMKRARLMPAAAVVAIGPQAPTASPTQWAKCDDIMHHEHLLSLSLEPVSKAVVPLTDATETTVIAFRPSDGGIEHLALVIGEPDPATPVLTRLHSECFTGDLLGSLRCDCGDQLRGAIKEIADVGSGVLLYMAQEGRGIGLVNKLRAYALQDAGFDTMEANEQLGFDDDERIFLPAAAILRQLGFGKIRLMTNNPFKVEALARHGIEITERVSHVFPSNNHNKGYLETKRIKGGHLF